MGYTAIQVPFRKQRFKIPAENASTTTYQNLTEDLKDLPQLMNPQQALRIVNYVVTTDGGLAKRGGLKKLFTVIGNHPITMFQKYTNDIYMYATNTKVSAYTISTNTVTDIHNFAGSHTASGQRYGEYFFVTNKTEKIARISRTLAYKAQTVNFTVGKILTGGTSGATAVILQDADAGATGVLTLGNIQGIFQDNELITDSAGGSATANGVVTFAYTNITDAPIAGVLKVVGPRLYAGDLSTDSTAVAYPAEDLGNNPPFTNWTVGSNASDPGLINYRNAGTVNAIDSLGNNIVILATNGKWAFNTTTVSNNNLLQKVDNVVFQRIDMGGSRASVVTPGGMFYVNKGGIWEIKSIGQSNVPFSEQEVKNSLLLGIDYFDNIDLSNADFAYNAKTDTIFLTCARSSTSNNLVIAYNIATNTFSEFSGWSINRFMNDNQVLFGAGSLATTVWQCFSGYSDDGKDIWTDFYQELKTGDLETRQIMLGQYVDGFLSPSTHLTVSFDIYDVTGTFIPNKIQFEWTPQSANGMSGGYGYEGYGDPYGSDLDSGNLIECFDGARGYVRNYQRIRVNITGHDQLPHSLVWIKILARIKINIRRRHLKQLT